MLWDRFREMFKKKKKFFTQSYYRTLTFAKLFRLLKSAIKKFISFLLVCFLIRLLLKLFRSEMSETTLKLFVEFVSKMPDVLVFFFFQAVQMYQDIEYFLWLFLYFFADFIEVILFYFFKIRLKYRPYDFVGLFTVFIILSIFWFLWF